MIKKRKHTNNIQMKSLSSIKNRRIYRNNFYIDTCRGEYINNFWSCFDLDIVVLMFVV